MNLMMTKNSQVEINSRVENLFKKLQKDPKSVLFSWKFKQFSIEKGFQIILSKRQGFCKFI